MITIETDLIFHIHTKLYILIILYSRSLGGEWIHISIRNKLKLGILCLWIIHMVHQNHVYQELGQNILYITPIQLEEAISVQSQYQYMDQFINMIWIFSYSISHFSWLTQAVSKGIINRSYQKVSYSSIMIYPVIHGFIPNKLNFICTFMINQLSLLV